LSLYGLRRGEVLGLRWSDIDLKARTLTVNQARVLVDCKVRIEPPKSRNGKRTLPLDDWVVAALMELRKRQARESETAGHAYRAGLEALDWYTAGDEYVVTDELGIPLYPEFYSDEFARLLKGAGLPKIGLHDSRHTTLSLMEKARGSHLDREQVGGSL
jgi:integrase